MPSKFVFEIEKKNFELKLKKQVSDSDLKISLTIPMEIELNDKDELDRLKTFLTSNLKLEYLKINLPGSLSFTELLTDTLINEQVPNLKITIQEKMDSVATTTFNEFL